MGKEIKTKLYIAGVLIGAGAIVAIAMNLWPVQWSLSSALTMAMVAGLVVLAARFPFKLSPQAEASLYTVPLYMGVLLLNPVLAVIAGSFGVAVSEVLERRQLKVAVFNVGVSVFIVALGGVVFRAALPAGGAFSLSEAITISIAMVAGLALHVSNLALVAGLITIRKGKAFWIAWKETWAIDLVQEGGALVLGAAGALLAAQALWAVTLLLGPVAFAYIAFRRSVDATRKSVELAESNGKLADELGVKLAELQETQEQLIVKSEKLASIGTTAASVVHEVKNAMMVTSGRADLLLRNSELYFKSERAIDHVKGIKEMTTRVADIVQELLAYSRADNEPVTTSLNEAMSIAADLVGRRATTQGITIEKRFGDTLPVKGVSGQLQQVFMNLLINAIDATPSGGTVTLSCTTEDGNVVASVKDTGTGISEEVLSRMYEPFYTTKEPGKGTGLGMFVCNKIIKEHEGNISVNTEEGTGTEFIITLPVFEEGASHQQQMHKDVEDARADIDAVLAGALEKTPIAVESF